MRDVLIEFNQSVKEIQASAIFSVDGVLLASTLPYNEDPDGVGAIAAAIHSLGNKTANILRRGNLQKIQIQGDKGNMFISALGSGALLAVLTTDRVNIGLLLHEMQRLNERMLNKEEPTEVSS